jgi:hypothetical protein
MTFGLIPENLDPDVLERRIKKRDEMLSNWESKMDEDNQRIPGIIGTAWAAYNSVSEWHDHERGRFGPVRESDGRAHSNLFGISDAQKRIAFDQAMALV